MVGRERAVAFLARNCSTAWPQVACQDEFSSRRIHTFRPLMIHCNTETFRHSHIENVWQCGQMWYFRSARRKTLLTEGSIAVFVSLHCCGLFILFSAVCDICELLIPSSCPHSFSLLHLGAETPFSPCRVLTGRGLDDSLSCVSAVWKYLTGVY